MSNEKIDISQSLDAWAWLVNTRRLDETDEQLKQRILAARDSNVLSPPPSPNCRSTAAVNPHLNTMPPISFCDLKLGVKFYRAGKTWVKTSYNQMAEWDGQVTGSQDLRRFDGPLTELVKVVE